MKLTRQKLCILFILFIPSNHFLSTWLAYKCIGKIFWLKVTLKTVDHELLQTEEAPQEILSQK